MLRIYKGVNKYGVPYEDNTDVFFEWGKPDTDSTANRKQYPDSFLQLHKIHLMKWSAMT